MLKRFLLQWLKAQGQKANCEAQNNLFMKELKVLNRRSSLKTQEILIPHLAVGLWDIYNKHVYFEIVDNDIFMFLLSKLLSYNPLWSWVLLKMCQGYGCSYLSTSKWCNDQRRAKFYDPFKVFENDIKRRLQRFLKVRRVFFSFCEPVLTLLNCDRCQFLHSASRQIQSMRFLCPINPLVAQVADQSSWTSLK